MKRHPALIPLSHDHHHALVEAREEFVFDNVGDIGAAAESAGFGFGQQGTAAGRFYDLPDPPMAPPVPISSNEPK